MSLEPDSSKKSEFWMRFTSIWFWWISAWNCSTWTWSGVTSYQNNKMWPKINSIL